jgi:hypothetical protein
MAKKQSEKKSTSKKTPAPVPKAPKARVEAKKPAAAKKTAAPESRTPEVETAPAANGTPAAPRAPRTPDPRLPAPGTVLQKLDRHGIVRCECTIEEGGVRYAGKVYRSLSSAAMAAAKDLGLTNKTQNGFVFWGLSKPPRPARDPLAALERAWERYRGSVEAVVKDGASDETRGQVLAAITKHAESIEALREKVA